MSNVILSIVIPCLKESKNLKKLIPEIKFHLGKKFIYEIIIIDGLFVDNETFDIANKNKIRYLNRKNNNYYGSAVKLGIKKSLGRYILFMDGDFSHHPKFILKLYNERLNDVIIASRYIKGGKTDNTFILMLLSKVLNIFYSFVLDLNLKDFFRVK